MSPPIWQSGSSLAFTAKTRKKRCLNHEGISSFGLRHLFHIIQKGWVPSMRVITGTAKGRKLITADGLDVRPTSDRVKEAMFSIVQFDVPGATVLDLFAGSGQLSVRRCICDLYFPNGSKHRNGTLSAAGYRSYFAVDQFRRHIGCHLLSGNRDRP